MATKTRRSARRNPPAAVELDVRRATPTGDTVPLGSRDLLSIDEAAAVLKRPRGEVLRAIRAGFLRARRGGGRPQVTVGACVRFLTEEEHDRAAADRVERRIRAGGEAVLPWRPGRRDLHRRDR